MQASWKSRNLIEKSLGNMEELVIRIRSCYLSDYINDAIHEELLELKNTNKITEEQYSRIATFEEDGRRIKEK